MAPGLNAELNFLRDYSKYSYELKQVIQKGPKPIFVIAFRPKKDRNYWSGNIYIEKNTWAILVSECNYSAWKNDKSKSIKESFSCEYFKFNDAYYPLKASYTESIRSRKNVITTFPRYWEVLDITNGSTEMINPDNLVDKGISYSTLADYQKNLIKMRNFKKKSPFVRSYFLDKAEKGN